VDDTEAVHEFKLFLHTAPANRFRLEADRVVVEGARAELEIQVEASFTPRFSLSSYGPFPRLEIAGHAVRGLFVLLLHPRRPDQPAARFRAVLQRDAVEVGVELGPTRHRYQFNTATRSVAAPRANRISVDRLE
jgi:hypothetical protein